MAEVVLSNLTKSFGTTEALRDVSLTIADGAFVVLLGLTGPGRTKQDDERAVGDGQGHIPQCLCGSKGFR